MHYRHVIKKINLSPLPSRGGLAAIPLTSMCYVMNELKGKKVL